MWFFVISLHGCVYCPEEDVRCLSLSLVHYSFSRRSLTEPGAKQPANPSNLPISSLYSSRVTGMGDHFQLFM